MKEASCWRERTSSPRFFCRRVFKVISVILLVAVVFHLGRLYEANQQEVRQAYQSFDSLKAGKVAPDMAMVAHWRELIGSSLEPHLNDVPRQLLTDDHEPLHERLGQHRKDRDWGFAYLVMRDEGPRSWSYHESMSSDQQDEVIAYLCFRIRELENNIQFTSGSFEFYALATYPRETIDRNQARIKLALDTFTRYPSPGKHARSGSDQLIPMLKFCVQRIDHEWVAEWLFSTMVTWAYRIRTEELRTAALHLFIPTYRDHPERRDAVIKLASDFAGQAPSDPYVAPVVSFLSREAKGLASTAMRD